jgi:hypothetical protein
VGRRLFEATNREIPRGREATAPFIAGSRGCGSRLRTDLLWNAIGHEERRSHRFSFVVS